MTAGDFVTAETAAAHRAIEAVWRLESARIIAGLTGLLRDVEGDIRQVFGPGD